MAKRDDVDAATFLVGGVVTFTGYPLLRDHQRRRATERQMLAARQMVAGAAAQIAPILGLAGRPIVFDACANASTNGHWICFSTQWAARWLRKRDKSRRPPPSLKSRRNPS
jgi:hypothetical protein